MTIKVTTRGTPPSEKIWTGKCWQCKSEMEAKKSDLRFVQGDRMDPREHDNWEAPCPVCSASVVFTETNRTA